MLGSAACEKQKSLEPPDPRNRLFCRAVHLIGGPIGEGTNPVGG